MRTKGRLEKAVCLVEHEEFGLFERGRHAMRRMNVVS
jgi:hypothetical protein